MAIRFINLKRIVGKRNFSDNLRRLLNVIKEWNTAWISCGSIVCLVVNPIMVGSYGFFINNTTVGQATDLMTALRFSFIRQLVPDVCRLWAQRSST